MFKCQTPMDLRLRDMPNWRRRASQSDNIIRSYFYFCYF